MATVHTVSHPRRLLYQYINYMLVKRIFLASPMVHPCCRARIIISIWKTQPLEMHDSINFCSTSFLYSLKYKRHNKISTKPRFVGRLIKTVLYIVYQLPCTTMCYSITHQFLLLRVLLFINTIIRELQFFELFVICAVDTQFTTFNQGRISKEEYCAFCWLNDVHWLPKPMLLLLLLHKR